MPQHWSKWRRSPATINHPCHNRGSSITASLFYTPSNACRQEAAELNNPEESIASFLSTFASMQAAVLASVAETQRAGPSQPGAMQQLDDALAQVIALEASTSQAAYFLPAYDLRQCTCAIQDIKGRVEEVRGELAPKKKFSFSKKVTRTKANELTMAPSTTGEPQRTAAHLDPTCFAHMFLLMPNRIQSFFVCCAISACSRAPFPNQPRLCCRTPGHLPAVDASRPRLPSAGDTSAVATDAATGAPQPAAISPQDLAQVEAGRGLRGLTGQVVVKGAEEVAGHDYVLIDLQVRRRAAGKPGTASRAGRAAQRPGQGTWGTDFFTHAGACARQLVFATLVYSAGG